MKSTLPLSLLAVLIIVLGLIGSAPLWAQDQVAQPSTSTSVPNLIRYGGVLRDANGVPLSSQTIGVTFSIYKEAEGGVSLWHETRNVATDASGQYSVLLGSTMTEGVPVELFADQDQRWLSVQVQGQAEPTRALLVSVPYAFKAHDAETLGGLPASAFMKAPTTEAAGSASSETALAVNAVGSAALVGGSAKATGSSGNSKTPCPPGTNHIMYWDASNDICPSVITQDPGNGNLGVGLPSNVPASEPLDVWGVISTYQWFDINENRILSVGNSGQANNASTNLFIGWNTGTVNNSDTANNTFTGRDAGASNTNGHDNTFSGYQAGNANTGGNNDVGSFNTFTGSSAGLLNSTGFLNTFTGYTAGFGNRNGYQNSCFGSAACLHNLTGIQNVALGAAAGFRNMDGSANVYVGFDSGFGISGVGSRGSNNTMTGWETGFDNYGSSNVFYGYQAGFSNTTGNFNIAVGALAGSAAGPNQSNNIYIGNLGQVESGPAIRIGVQGNPHINQTYIGGIVTNPMDGSFVVVGADGHLGIAKPFSGTLVTGGCSLGPNYLTKWTGTGAVGCTHVWENMGSTYFVGIGPNWNTGNQPNRQLQVNGDIDIPVTSTAHYQVTGKTVLSIDGTNNIFTGIGAGNASGSTTGNTFTGYNAGNLNTADGNSFYGFESGAANTTGIQNVFAGYQAGVANDTGYSNIFIGYKAGQANTTESYSTFVGTVAGFNSTVGGNTFLGYSAGSNTTVGYGNVATGYDAGRSNQEGILNAYYGVNAGFNGSLNTFTHGSYNTYLGNGAGSSGGLVNGSNNIFLGFAAGNNEGDVSNNIEIGNSGPSPLGVQSNTILIGTKAVYNKVFFDPILNHATNLNQVVTIDANGQLGFNTIQAGGGGVTGNCPLGANYLARWTNSNNPGDINCSVVFQQPTTNNIGINNTNPSEALDVTGVINASQWYDITAAQLPVLSIDNSPVNSADNNLFVGIGAGNVNTSGTGTSNTFIGANAGNANTVGTNNTFLGAYAGNAASVGDSNIFVGASAGVNSSGSNNTFLGNATGNTTSGSANIAIGLLAGTAGSGGNNIDIGSFAGSNDSGASNDILIGNIGNGSSGNQIMIGNGQANTYVAGIWSSTPGGAPQSVCVDSFGKLWGSAAGCTGSSRRFKDQIANMDETSSKLFQLRPVTFFYKPQYDDGSHHLQYGLIAEEVAKVYPEMAVYDKDGVPSGVKYQLLAPMLLNELQKQHKVVTAQQDELTSIREQATTQQQQVLAQQQQIDSLKSQLQLQNAAFQERLSRLESALSTQVAVADKTTRTAASPNGGMQ